MIYRISWSMKRPRTPSAVVKGLAALFTVLWWYLLIASGVVIALVLIWGVNVGVQIGPDGEPNFVAGSRAQMVLPVAFALEGSAAQVTSLDGRDSGTVESASGLLRFSTTDRPWLAIAGATVMMLLALWVVAELGALCRSVRDGQPFTPRNVVRIRRLALAFVLSEVSRAAIVYTAQAYAAGHFTATGLRFTAWPDLKTSAIVTALVLLVLAEVFRTGTRLDEDQSLTV
jgi:hypothetical protein